MAIILNLETATKNCSVSLFQDNKMLSLVEYNEGQFSHAEKLHTFILDVLNNSNKSMKDLDAISVSKGPGSYTGLRIGVSAAKGLCFSLDIPLISVLTLRSMADSSVLNKDGIIIPLLDARRMEVYSAVFDKYRVQIRETMAEIVDGNSFLEYLNKGVVYFIGDGAAKCQEIIQHKNARFVIDYFPSAKDMGRLAFDKYKNSDFEDVAYFEPYYLKDFLAGKPKKLF